jgi:uncharacterized protein
MPGIRKTISVALILSAIAYATEPPAKKTADDARYRAQVEQWRAERVRDLKRENGWLSLVGLFTLHPGESTVGSGKDNRIQFPQPAPTYLGKLKLANNQVTFRPAGQDVRVNGQPLTAAAEIPLKIQDNADQVQFGSMVFFLIERGNTIYIRLTDNNSRLRTHFHGIDHFPLDRRYRFVADFIPGKPGETIAIPNVLGQTSHDQIYGRATFSLGGKQYTLTGTGEAGKEVDFVFYDQTGVKETYGAGRFLESDGPPVNGKLVIDFNKAYNPPCAFTPYATCPIAPKQNRLGVRIPAGEKNFSEHK